MAEIAVNDEKPIAESPGRAMHARDREVRRAAARLLGSVKNEKRAAASRRNGVLGGPLGRLLGGKKPRPLGTIPCTCGGATRPEHLSRCPRGMAIRRRIKNGWP